MDVNVKRAVKMFFSKSSFEMVYFEAFANALDAGATSFNINIILPKPNDLSGLSLELSDNGEGFTDCRFGKFKRLLDVEERTHKGLGRLVYLCYFDRVQISSVFEPHHVRNFEFTEEFDGNYTIGDTSVEETGTKLTFTGFNGEKLGKLDYISPSYIKRRLLENFYMKFYKAKLSGCPVNVTITFNNNVDIVTETINVDTIPEFRVVALSDQADLFNRIDLYYFIRQTETPSVRSLITALAVDDRTHRVTIITDENIPYGYEMVFLLMSETFQGNIDESRQNLTIEEPKLKLVKTIFRDAIADVLNREFPQMAESNVRRKEYLEKTYPHLSGYFEEKEIGYSKQSDLLAKAQDKYFNDQREILGAVELNDEQYEKSLDLSARALAEYVVFRQNVINKMRTFDGKEKEADLHNLLVPKGAEFHEGELIKDLYCNNVWVLDEKFMSYCTVLSEAEMTKVIDVLTEGEINDSDDDRPDIVLFFSGDPNKEGTKVDVVVVELKRLGISAENNSIVEFQLDTRTQRLARYYGNRIQRMWFYGIVDFDDKYRLHLINNGFKPLFSNGSSYFRSKEVYSDLTQTVSVMQNAYILDFTALVEDADSRNETFLKILKNNFKKRQ